MPPRKPHAPTERSPQREERALATEDGFGHPVQEPASAERRYEEIIAASELSSELFTGAFGTHVWGGRYEIDSPFRDGGQSSTFLGTDRKTGARVVAKVLDIKGLDTWKQLELFEREVRVLSSLSHPLMPQFLDVLMDEDTGARALIMTHIPGDDLSRVLKKEGPLSEAALWQTLLDVSESLAVLHRASSPLVHRDVKPQNLVRRPDGRVALVDFGGVGSAHRSDGSTVVGTFGYMAPEQLYGQSSPATDLYALGASLLTLSTGKEPEVQQRQGLGIDVDRSAPHLSESLRSILRRLVQPEPAQRYADAAALLQELHKLSDVPTAQKAQPSPADERNALTDALNLFAAWLTILVSFFGFALCVVLGNVLLPVFFSILEAFLSKKSRARAKKVRSFVNTGVYSARDGFQRSMNTGVEQIRRPARKRARGHGAYTPRRAQRRPRGQKRR